MPDKEKVELNGKEFEGTRVHINQENAPWSEYVLDDGTILKRRAIITDILRLEGAYEPDGTPVYWIKGQLVNNVRAPAELMRKS